MATSNENETSPFAEVIAGKVHDEETAVDDIVNEAAKEEEGQQSYIEEVAVIDDVQEYADEELEEEVSNQAEETNILVPIRAGDIYVDQDLVPRVNVIDVSNVLLDNGYAPIIKFKELGEGRELNVSVNTFNRYLYDRGYSRFDSIDVLVKDYLDGIEIQDGYLYTMNGKPYLETIDTGLLFDDKYEGIEGEDVKSIRLVRIYVNEEEYVGRFVFDEYLKRTLFRYSDQFADARIELGF